MEHELRLAMAALPHFDYSNPAVVRANMTRFQHVSTSLGLRNVDDPEVEVLDRAGPSHAVATVGIRIYIPRNRVKPSGAVTYFHGGAFVIGGLELEHTRCLEMAKATQSVVIAADYRLAPEHPFPAGAEDCYAVYRWVTMVAEELDIDVSRVAVAGSSAGGALAAAVTMMARDRGGSAPAFQLLLYPVLDDRMATPSMLNFVDIKGWNRTNSEYMWRHYLGDTVGEVSPYAAPARAKDLRRLPPGYIMTADYDALRDEGMNYGLRLIEACVPVELHHYPGTFHGFDTLVDSEISRRARNEHYAVLRSALRSSMKPAFATMPDRVSF